MVATGAKKELRRKLHADTSLLMPFQPFHPLIDVRTLRAINLGKL